jgi:hypothetical protein
MPNRLFHYQRFVEEHLVSLLSERKVKISRPDSFNDPWDCRVHYRLPTDGEERQRLLNWLVDMHQTHFPKLMNDAERIRIAENLISNPLKLRRAFLRMEGQLYQAICKKYRVYCLSEKPNSALMWAHYAASHAGVCLEFDAVIEPFTLKTGATRVEYQETYPAYDIVTAGYKPLVTKSADWSYEAEWRLIAEERAFAEASDSIKTDDDFLVLPSSALKSVTIGCLASEPSRRVIDDLIRIYAPDVLIRQASPARDRYELSISPPFEQLT